MYFPFLALAGVFGGTIQFIRRIELRLTGERDTSPPRDWTMRGGDGAPSHFATRPALERDDWSRQRPSLDIDVWSAERRKIDSTRPGRELIQAVPRRREFILDKLDAGECLNRFRPGIDIPKNKISANSRHRYIPKTSPFYRTDRVPATEHED
jgi:hypothetical protein